MERSVQRARAAGWPVHEVATVHPITPDPDPKAAILARTLADHVAVATAP
jgi:hypothetical protein